MEQLKEVNEELELSLPECKAESLVLLFYEAGMYENTINGVAPLSWTEIQNWLSATKRQLTVWEIDTIREMSKAYCSEYHASKSKHSAPPWISDEDAYKEQQARNLELFFDSMIATQTKD